MAEKVRDFGILKNKVMIYDSSKDLKKIDLVKQRISPVKKGHQLSVQQISCGRSHTLILTKSGYVHSFGQGEFGQLG